MTILQVYQTDVDDLLRPPKAKGKPDMNVSQICQPVRSVQDINQVLKIAQQNREQIAALHELDPTDMKRKSHLIVRIAPENLGGGNFDFVELCGSDLAANLDFASNTREMEKDRSFAASSFNSLS